MEPEIGVYAWFHPPKTIITYGEVGVVLTHSTSSKFAPFFEPKHPSSPSPVTRSSMVGLSLEPKITDGMVIGPNHSRCNLSENAHPKQTILAETNGGSDFWWFILSTAWWKNHHVEIPIIYRGFPNHVSTKGYPICTVHYLPTRQEEATCTQHMKPSFKLGAPNVSSVKRQTGCRWLLKWRVISSCLGGLRNHRDTNGKHASIAVRLPSGFLWNVVRQSPELSRVGQKWCVDFQERCKETLDGQDETESTAKRLNSSSQCHVLYMYLYVL